MHPLLGPSRHLFVRACKRAASLQASQVVGRLRSSRPPRGAAAAEFAIIAPLLVTLLIGFFVVGLMQMARLQVQAITAATVRSCVAMQNNTDALNTYTSCLNTRFAALLLEAGNPCSGAPTLDTPMPSLLSTTGAINGSNQHLYLLRLQVRCSFNAGAISALVPGMASTIKLNVSSAMPFVKG